MSKYFVVSPSIKLQDKEVINKLRQEQEVVLSDVFSQKRELDNQKLKDEDTLRHIEGKVIVKVDVDGKDSWTFENGQKIEYKRRFNNFNQRETQPVNAFVISGEGMKKGSEILIHANSIHDTNRIFDYKEDNKSVQYFSIQNEMCFAWYDEDKKEWQPLPPYELALRVFEPYDGIITNIEPKQLKDTLFVLSGEFKNKVVRTLVACDYQIIYQGKNGREQSLIRFRPSGTEEREAEAIAILDEITEKVLSGKLLIGFTTSDAKPFSND